jgi:hypothetical protein
MKKDRIILEVDGASVPMNLFVQKIFANTILGMVRSLNKVKKNPRQILIAVMKEDKG